MRRILVVLGLASAPAMLLVSPARRVQADAPTLTVTSNASIRTGAAIHVQFNGGFPLVQDNQIGPSATNFTTYDHTMDAQVSEKVPDVGTLSASSHTTHTTSVASGVDSVTVVSSGSVTGTATADPKLGLDDQIGGGGSTTLQVQVMSTAPVSFTVSASTTVTGPSPGESSVIFSDGREEDRRVADADIDVGVHRPSATFSQSGRLDGSPSRPAFVELDVTCRGGAGSPFTTGSARWNVRLSIGPQSTDGDIYRWVKKKAGSYDTPENWDKKKVPADDDAARNDTAVFDLPGKYTVDLGAPVSTARAPRAGPPHRDERIFVIGGKPTLLHGQVVADSLSESEPSVIVLREGELILQDATLTSRGARLGAPFGTKDTLGIVDVRTAGRWDNSGTMTIGNPHGAGHLEIGSDGVVTSSHTVVVGTAVGAASSQAGAFGAGAVWQPGNLEAGDGAPGSKIIIEAGEGAAVTTDVASFGGPSVVKVKVHGVLLGVATSWSTAGHTLGIGAGGQATFRMLEGATGMAGRLLVGSGGTGDGTMSVEGTAADGNHRRTDFNATQDVFVGQQPGAVGHLEVKDGGTFTDDGDLDVGATGSRGVVDVTGSASPPPNLRVKGSARLGTGVPRNGFGLVHVSGQGAAFLVDGDLAVGRIGEGAGLVAIENGGIFGVGGTLSINVGTVRLTDATLNAGHLSVGANGTLAGTGRLIVAGIETDGQISPGNSPGTLTIEGDLVVNAGGVIDAEVAGPDDLSDHLVVTGNATLNGTLVLHFMNGFAPKTSDHFEVLHVNGATTGDFAAVDVQGLAPGAQFQIAQNGPSYVVTATNDATALPTVSAKAPKRAKERSRRPVFVTLTRSGKPTGALVVNYVLEGTAEVGVDYATLSGTVTFPAKKRSVKVAIQPIDDFTFEGNETVRLSVVPGAGYSRSLKPTAEIAIVDDER